MAEVILVLAAGVVLGFGVLALARAIEGSGSKSWLRKVNFKHLVLALLVLAALFLLAESPRGLLVLCGAIVLVLFAREWVREFYFLMDLRDDDLPGRFDKPVWAFLMIAFAPVGLWLFRGYHHARWPEPEVEAKPARSAELS
jgi:hypothetical protein